MGDLDIQVDTGFGNQARIGWHLTRHNYVIGFGVKKTVLGPGEFTCL